MTDQGLKQLKDNLLHSSDMLRASAHPVTKDLYKKLAEERANVIVDCYKDEQP